MKCDALWVVDYKKLDIRPHMVEGPKYDELLIETKACGVCCWDAYQFQGQSGPGPYPYVIGHEAAGLVVEVGKGIKKFKPGD
jgi:Zn-dependent alcohol dehydrogenase